MKGHFPWPSEVSGWKRDRQARVYTAKTLFEYIDGAAEVYLAYGLQRTSVRRYLKPGHPDIVAEIYRMASSDDAFGVFSLEQQDPEAGLGQGSEFGGSMLRFWKGRFFVAVLGEGTGQDLEAAVLALGRALADGIKETGDPPQLLRYLPLQPAFPRAEKVVFLRSHILLNRLFFVSHQNILKLNREVQAVLARIPADNKKIHLLIVGYPTRARARSAVKSFISGYLPEAGQNRAVLTEDGTWTRADRCLRLVVIVFGAPSESDAAGWAEAVLSRLEEKCP
jgi:hypothetical protein